MSRSLPPFVLALAMCQAAAAAADPPTELPLWPGPAPGEKGDVGPEKYIDPKPGEDPTIPRLTNVSKPAITVYRPAKDANTGAAVVIAPGGGYTILAWDHEGTQTAEWLRSLGVTGVLLKYRVPRRPDQPKDEPPVGALQDAQRAVRLVREHAKEWGVDPARVGMLGFSAGGHLTAWTATNSDKRSYDPVDAADKQSCRPDFVAMIYPGGVVKKGTKAEFRPEIRVSKDTPPAFLVVSIDDKGSFDSTVALTAALKEAGVPAELHVYPTGGHGYGMRPSNQSFATWPKRCEEWLRTGGWLSAKK